MTTPSPHPLAAAADDDPMLEAIRISIDAMDGIKKVLLAKGKIGVWYVGMVSLAIESMEMVDQCARARISRCGKLVRLLCTKKISDLAVAKCLSSKKT